MSGWNENECRGKRHTFEINVILVCDGQDVVALVRLDGLDEVSLRGLEVDLYSANRTTRAGSNQK